MLDNPNANKTSSPHVVNVRRHNSLPTSLRSSSLRSSLKSSSKSLRHPIQEQLLHPTMSTVPSPHPTFLIPTSSAASAAVIVHYSLPLSSLRRDKYDLTKRPFYHNYNKYHSYSLRIVSKRLNKSNPYVGSFRHSPPTSFRDLRFQALSRHQQQHQKWNSTTRCSSYHSNLIEHDANIVSSLLNQSLLCTNHVTLDEMMKKQPDNRDVVATDNEDDECRDCSNSPTTKKNHYRCNHKNRYSSISGHLRGGSPRNGGCNSKASPSSSALHEECTITYKILGNIASWLLHMDNSLPFIADEHIMIPKAQQVQDRSNGLPKGRRERQNGGSGNLEVSECESSVSVSEIGGDDDSSYSDSSSSNQSSSDDSSYDNYDTAYGSRTVPVDDTTYYANVQSPISTIDVGVGGGARTGSAMDASCISVLSTQAEAYYAQTSVTNQLEASITNQTGGGGSSNTILPKRRSNSFGGSYHPPNPVSYAPFQPSARPPPSPTSAGRMDYETITQMDIVRMTRIASRHLDVTSICQLPTITYRKQPSQNNNVGADDSNTSSNEQSKHCNESKPPVIASPAPRKNPEFSWMMVHAEHSSDDDVSTTSTIESRDSSEMGLKITTTRTVASSQCNANSCAEQHGTLQQQHDQDVCVICLEHFVDGDRLRVLPCRHSFHIGCIDRWLSGSHSFDDCYTAGCPTCKKYPSNNAAIRVNDTTANTHGRTTSITDPGRSDWNTTAVTGGTAPALNAVVSTSSTGHVINNEVNGTNGTNEFLHESMDGSVPSWSFSQIGGALARESRHMY